MSELSANEEKCRKSTGMEKYSLKIKTFFDITLFRWDRLLILHQQCVNAFFKQRVVGHLAQSAPFAVAIMSTHWHSYRERNTKFKYIGDVLFLHSFVLKKTKKKRFSQPCLTNDASPL
jgi:hypothetical protein